MKRRMIHTALLAAAMMAAGISACSGPKAGKTDYNYQLTQEDTTAMLGLASSCLDTLRSGRIETALDMLYVVRNDTLMPISKEQRAKMTKRFAMFPVLDYSLEGYTFSLYDGNEVKFRVKFAEGDEAHGLPPAYTGMKFSPVRHGTDWYLTVVEE